MIRAFDRVMEGFAAFLVLALLGAVTLGIVSRAWNDPFSWTDELARMLMIWLAMAGWIIAARRRAHVRIRFFHNMAPPRLWRAQERLIQLALLVLGVLTAWHGWALVGRNWDLDATSLPVSIGWMYVPLVPTGVIVALQAAAELVHPRRQVTP